MILVEIRGVFGKQWDCARFTNNFYRREKSIIFYDVTMSYGFETKFQHSVTTTLFFALFSVKVISLQPFRKNLIKLKTFGYFFLWCKE